MLDREVDVTFLVSQLRQQFVFGAVYDFDFEVDGGGEFFPHQVTNFIEVEAEVSKANDHLQCLQCIFVIAARLCFAIDQMVGQQTNQCVMPDDARAQAGFGG